VSLVFAWRDLVDGGGRSALSTPTLWVFLVLAALTHAFPVVAPRHQAYHVTQAFLLGAILLLPWSSVALIVLAIHIIEWLRRGRPWYIQLYNAGTYLLSSAAGVLALHALGGGAPFSLANRGLLEAAVAAAASFLVANHALTAVVLRLARGISLGASGLFGLDSLGVDAALLLLGVGIADAWNEQPLSLLVTSIPLMLVYRALRVPGLEQAAHRDRLTNLYNQRHFLEALQQELRRADALQHSTSVLVAALDHLPELVHKHGQPSIDFLMVALADRFTPCVRDFDVVASVREGVFGLLLPQVDRQEARRVAKSVLGAVGGEPYALPTTRESIRTSVSAAVVTMRGGSASASAVLDQLLRAVEQASLTRPGTLVIVDQPDGSQGQSGPPAKEGATPHTGERKVLPVALATPAYPRWGLRLVQWAVAVPAVVLTPVLLARGTPMGLEVAALIVGLVVVSEMLSFELYDRTSFSINFVPIMAAVVLFGSPGAVLGGWSAGLARGALQRSRWDRVLFNASVSMLFAVLAGLVFGLVDHPVRAGELGALALATVVASCVYYLHTFVVAAAVAIDIGARVRQVWVRNYRWMFPHYAILGLMGLGLAVATTELGLLGTILFLAPPLMMRFVLKQYTDRTGVVVKRLETANTELVATSGLLRHRGEELSLLSDIGQLLASEARPASLPHVVAHRCVPSLGDACALLWWEPAPGGLALHAEPRSQRVATHLAKLGREGVQRWAEEVAARGGCVVSVEGPAANAAPAPDGQWLAVPVASPTRTLGWLLSWRSLANRQEVEVKLALAGEVARRVGLALEHGVLLEEAATVDALRALDQAKTEFIATAAHELRTPLTSLQGYAELLQTQSVDPALRERWLSILRQESAGLALILDQLLDASRLDTGRFRADRRPMALPDVLDRALESFAGQATLSHHVLEVDVPQALPLVFADPAHVERILRSLLSNALKYAPGGGVVRIMVRPGSAAQLEVIVEDQGLGIPAAWLGRLFERFQRVETPPHAAIGGTGLGLYVARQLVELNGGRIWAASDGPGAGAAFHFTLCVAPPQVAERQPAAWQTS
jgi:diguanylate cyclase (GGDEF)-like protein